MDNADRTLCGMLRASSGQSPIDAETMRRAASRIEVLDGVIDLAYIPHRSLTEDNDRLRKERATLAADLADARKRLESIRHRVDSEWAAQVARKDAALREIQRIGTLHKDPYVPGLRFAEIATEALAPPTLQSAGDES